MDLYFSYGIEMNPHFMHSVCPGALFYGVGVCYQYRFQTNSSGLADIQPSHHSKVYGVVWKVFEHEIASLSAWAQNYFPHCISRYSQSIELLPNAQNELVHFPGIQSPVKVNAFFYHSLHKTSIPPSSKYMESILRELQLLEVPQDYISELRLWISS